MTPSTLEIAKHVGVSRPVVSKVLNGGKTNVRISDETRTKIEAAARELGYRPNAWAQAMSQGKTHAVGYVGYEFDEIFTTAGSPLVMTAISRALTTQDRHLLLSTVSAKHIRNGQWPKVFSSVLVDAVILDGTGNMPQAVFDRVAEYKIPHIAVNNRQAKDCVHPDDFGGAKQATEHLLKLGHRKIGFAATLPEDGHERHYSVDDRLAGYTQAMLDSGVSPRPVLRGFEQAEAGDNRELIAAMTGPDRVSAWVAYGPAHATDLYLTANAMGLSIPEDLSIMAMHRGGDLVRVGSLLLHTMLMGDPRLGQHAGEMILKKMDQPDVELDPVAVPFRYHDGYSVATPTP